MKTSLTAERFGHSQPIDTKDRHFSAVDGAATVGVLVVSQISKWLIFRNSKPTVPVSQTWNRTGSLLSWSEPALRLFEVRI